MFFVHYLFLCLINNLETAKTTKQFSISIKILKENSEVLARDIHGNINLCIRDLVFASDLELVDLTAVFKKKSTTSKDNHRPIRFYLIYLRYTKDLFAVKSRLSSMKSPLNIGVDFAKDFMRKMT